MRIYFPLYSLPFLSFPCSFFLFPPLPSLASFNSPPFLLLPALPLPSPLLLCSIVLNPYSPFFSLPAITSQSLLSFPFFHIPSLLFSLYIFTFSFHRFSASSLFLSSSFSLPSPPFPFFPPLSLSVYFLTFLTGLKTHDPPIHTISRNFFFFFF